MSENENVTSEPSQNKERNCWLYPIFIVVAVVLIIYTFGVCCHPYFSSKEPIRTDSIYKLDVVSIPNNLKAAPHNGYYDSVFADIMANRVSALKLPRNEYYDSIVAHVLYNQQMIIKRQDDLINDFRQETNNNLDKMNSLLTFWIGILALLGVFVPLILQYKLYNNDIAKIKEEASSFKEEASALERRANEVIKEAVKETDNIKSDLNIHKLINELECLNISSEYKLFPEEANGITVIKSKWEHVKKNLENVIESVFKDYESSEKRHMLTDCLIHVYGTLTIISRKCSKYRHRELNKIKATIQSLITNTSEVTYGSWEDLHHMMLKLSEELKSVNIFD